MPEKPSVPKPPVIKAPVSKPATNPMPGSPVGLQHIQDSADQINLVRNSVK
jgi:hypothetical protein